LLLRRRLHYARRLEAGRRARRRRRLAAADGRRGRRVRGAAIGLGTAARAIPRDRHRAAPFAAPLRPAVLRRRVAGARTAREDAYRRAHPPEQLLRLGEGARARDPADRRAHAAAQRPLRAARSAARLPASTRRRQRADEADAAAAALLVRGPLTVLTAVRPFLAPRVVARSAAAVKQIVIAAAGRM